MENPNFDGSNYVPEHDKVRLSAQMENIYIFMKHFSWNTLSEIANVTGYGEASISAQLRNLRKAKFGSHIVNKRRRGEKGKGLWEYQLIVNDVPVQSEIDFNE